MFTPIVILNKHTSKAESNVKRPRNKLGCAFCISVEYKRKENLPFLANTKYISSRAVKIYALVKNTDFFHRTR